MGPYFKHQVWEHGANASRRIPADEAPSLEVAIANRQKFETLANEFIELTVRLTRAGQSVSAQKNATRCLLSQEAEVAELIHRFSSESPAGPAVQQMEVLLRAAIFKPAAGIVGLLLQHAADRLDAAYQPRPGEHRKGRAWMEFQCLFGTLRLQRDYYHHPGKHQGHFPADAGLGLEGRYTPALARLVCLEG